MVGGPLPNEDYDPVKWPLIKEELCGPAWVHYSLGRHITGVGLRELSFIFWR